MMARPRIQAPGKVLNRAFATSAGRRTSQPAVTPSTLTSSSTRPARLRFAPSPTGFLHLGGLRTALFNHLLARKWKGKWILRIEDTDRTRLIPGAIDSLRSTLDWAGLQYDEGVGVGGSSGPYIQSERRDLYHHHAAKLQERDLVYDCFCTPEELHAIKMDMTKRGSKNSYDGRCRHLSEEEVVRRKKAGQKHVLRFKYPPVVDNLPRDLVFGEMCFPRDSPDDDFVIIKSDGFPTYHFASVVDDHEMAISHVLRGEEWLSSLPKHIGLYRAFGWEPPLFAHLPLLVNLDGTKLSKRSGDVRVDSYRDAGYEPEALLNFLALMGWDHHSALDASLRFEHDRHASATGSEPLPTSGPGSSLLEPSVRRDHNSLHEIFTLPQLVSAFSLEHVNHRKAAVNLSKLDFINKMTLRRKAGRLGEDGVMIDRGKQGLTAAAPQEHQEQQQPTESLGDVATERGVERERADLVRRVQGYLKEQDELRDNPLVDDLAYVEAVFDAELPRTVKLSELGTSSMFMFLDPDYTDAESTALLKSLDKVTYITCLEKIIPELEACLDASADGELTTDLAWTALKPVIRELRLRSNSQMLMPMRHALTGRRNGPGVPAIMSVLGAERTLDRLRAGLKYVIKQQRGGNK